MQEILVIRFSSLGDLCLLGASLARLSARSLPDEQQVTLVTKAAFAPLMEQVQGVDRVIPLAGSSWRDLQSLAAELRTARWDEVIDAHNTLRSRLLLGMMGRRPGTRLAKDTLARLAFMKFGKHSPKLERTMSRRFDDLFRKPHDSRSSETGSSPDPDPVSTPAFSSFPTSPNPVLGLAPGAQWETKQWPEENFSDFLTRFRQRSSTPVRILLGPREAAWFPGSRLAATADRLEGISIIRGLSQVQVLESLAGCSLLLTNDSGLLHLAEAAGTPVVALFGPTVRQFGYYPRLADSTAMEISLECRPCSRNGKRPCHRGDLACLESITPEEVLQMVLTSPAWSRSEERS